MKIFIKLVYLQSKMAQTLLTKSDTLVSQEFILS